MDHRVIAPVLNEPLSLAEVKLHLRHDSGTFGGDVAVAQSIAPGDHAISEVTGAAVDVLGKLAVVNLSTGVVAGKVAAKIQESEDKSVWSDYTAFAEVTAANDEAVQEVEYLGAMQYVRVVAVVTVAASKFSAEVVTSAGTAIEDAYLKGLIMAARDYCEVFTGRALATQTIEAVLPYFPAYRDDIALPRPPLQSVSSIKYKDHTGTETTLTANTDYLVDADSSFGRVVLPYGGSWPQFAPYPIKPVVITYIAGYSDDKPIPEVIRRAMLLLIGHWYANREAVVVSDSAGKVSTEVEMAVKSLLTLHRMRWF